MSQNFVLFLADAGVPMIFLTFPAMVMLLLPVILLEGWLLRKWLGLETWEAAKSSTVANIASTLLGVPAAWMVMLCFEFGLGSRQVGQPDSEGGEYSSLGCLAWARREESLLDGSSCSIRVIGADVLCIGLD
jgi:hypothetical protein